MQRPTREIARLARRLEQELRGVEPVSEQSRTPRLPGGLGGRGLARIEEEAEEIHSHARRLVARTPHDVAETLAELKRRAPEGAAGGPVNRERPMAAGACARENARAAREAGPRPVLP